MIPAAYFSYLAPEIFLTLWAIALLLVEAFAAISPRRMTALALGGIGFIFIVTLFIGTPAAGQSSLLIWSQTAQWDGAAKFFHLFFLAVAAFVIWMGQEVQPAMSQAGSEFAILPLFTTTGLMLLACANDFMLLFVALELVTISFYILVAYRHRSLLALEAGVKYLIMGGLSSAFLVMGIAYIFGVSGATRFDLLVSGLQHDPHALPAGIGLGLLLVLTGVGFKIAMVPFHSWAPDVYEGAPLSITAFLSVGSKAGGLIILMRIVLGVFAAPASVALWLPLLEIGAVASLLLGNLAAIPQRHLKRLMGYSSIGHTGFILVAVIGASNFLPGAMPLIYSDGALAQMAVAVYLVTYLLATFTGFLVLASLEDHLPGLETHHLAGLAQRSPLLAAAFAMSLISLAGIPPLGGFVAKAMVILIAWDRGLYVLLGFTLFAAVAALYYYLGPIKAMYWSEPLDEAPIPLPRVVHVLLIILIVLLIVSGFWAQSLFLLARGVSFQPTGF